MKNSHLVILAFGLALSTACQNQNSETVLEELDTEASFTDTIPGNYGGNLDVTGVVSPSEMISVVEMEGNFEGKISGEIKEVCTKNMATIVIVTKMDIILMYGSLNSCVYDE